MEDLEGIFELNESEGIYIDIGTKVYIAIEGVNFPVSSIFIGMLKNEFMLVTPPKKYKSVKNRLFPGGRLVVKYLYEGSVYAFQTSVIELITKPIRALAIEFPKVVQETELRIAKRNNVVIPGRVEAKKVDFAIVVNDISKKGCRFKYRDDKRNITSLREGDLLKIYCQFPGVSNETGAMACVRNVRREQGQLSVGAEFQGPTKAFLTPLIHFLFSIEDFI